MALSNTQYDKLMRIYEDRQKEDRETLMAREEAVKKKIPSYENVDREISDLSIRTAKALLEGGEGEDRKALLKGLNEKIGSLRERKTALLREGGFPPDYLEGVYTCPDCHDTGFIGNEPCHCFKQASLDLVYRQSHLTRAISSLSFSDFRTDIYPADLKERPDGPTAREAAEKALKRAEEFVSSFGSTKGKKDEKTSFLIMGETGVGKTLLTNIIANSLLKKNFSVIYFTAFGLFDLLEKYTFGHDESVRDDFESLFTCDLLVIDDLGTEMTNAFTTSRFFEILNERLLRMKAILLTTNLNLKELNDRYTERSFSRMTQSFRMIRLFGKDFRKDPPQGNC